MINEIKNKVEANLKNFISRAEIKYKFKSINHLLHKSIHEYCLRKGKRIRPLLFLLSYKGYSPSRARIHTSIYNISSAIELLHNFMLIHDDIIDRSDLRRGKPTMHKLLEKAVVTKESSKLGNDLGIIAGDIIYALSLDVFLQAKIGQTQKEKALKYFVETTATTAIGEYIDTLHGAEKLSKIKEKDIYLNYDYKTARYTFVTPLVIGAILAGASESEIKKLSDFGMLIGEAFQIQDDIIGIFGTVKSIGKSILSDFLESKKTLLVCNAFEKLSKKEKEAFLKIYNKPKKTTKDLISVKKIFIESGSLKYCLKQITVREEKAFKIFKSLKLKDTVKKEISNLFLNIFKPSSDISQKYNIDLKTK